MPRINIKDKRKQQLIDANIASIAKRGLSETTIAHVSQGAGMSRGIVNFYFTTKESMMQETCQYLAEEYTAVWERALEKLAADVTPAAALRAIISAHFQANVCNQKRLAVWVAFWGHASSHNEYKKIIADADAKLLEKVAGLWQEIPDTALDATAFSYELQSLIRGLWLNFLLSAQGMEREVLVQKAHAYLGRAVAAAYDAGQVPASNITDLQVAKEEAAKSAAKKKTKPAAATDDKQGTLGDLFALG